MTHMFQRVLQVLISSRASSCLPAELRAEVTQYLRHARGPRRSFQSRSLNPFETQSDLVTLAALVEASRDNSLEALAPHPPTRSMSTPR